MFCAICQMKYNIMVNDDENVLCNVLNCEQNINIIFIYY